MITGNKCSLFHIRKEAERAKVSMTLHSYSSFEKLDHFGNAKLKLFTVSEQVFFVVWFCGWECWPYLFGPDLTVSPPIQWIAINVFTDIHGSQRRNLNDFGDHLAFFFDICGSE